MLDPEAGYGVHNGVVLVELRSVPECPNLDKVRTALRTAMAELGLSPVVVERVGDYPSPSVLIDGADVMGGGDGPAACRLDLPSVDTLRDALRRATGPTSPAPAGPAMPGVDCCVTPGNAIRVDRPDRARRLSPELRQLHQAILRHFAGTGAAPQLDDIAAAAPAGLDPREALRQLAADDLVAIDDTDTLVAAYPFSPRPTAHRVTVDEVRTFAMCAIDALGIPFMLGTDATIDSADPQTGQPVRATVAARMLAFEQPDAVVVYAATATAGRSVDTCCSTINFFASEHSARTWLDDRPQLVNAVLDQDDAVQLAREIFEPLLRDGDGDDPATTTERRA